MEEQKKYYDLPQVIDVLVAGDRNVYEGICLCALSAVTRTKRPIRLHLMTTFAVKTKGITKDKAELLDQKLKEISPESSVDYIDVTADYGEHFTDSKNAKPVYRQLANGADFGTDRRYPEGAAAGTEKTAGMRFKGH